MPDPNETTTPLPESDPEPPPAISKPEPPDHLRVAGQDKIGMLEAAVQVAGKQVAAETAPVPAQLSMKERIAKAIRQHWMTKFRQDWGAVPCAMIAESVAADLRDPPQAALEAAGITDEQWTTFIAAVAEGK